LKNQKKIEVAIIGGSGLETLLSSAERVHIGTPYGLPSTITIGTIDTVDVAFLPRHGEKHKLPPHRINHKANLHALYQLGVKRIIATNAVGAINQNFKPADLVIPHDFIDFAYREKATFYDSWPVTHVDFSQPYCPQLRQTLIKAARTQKLRVHTKGVLVCTSGPRFETPAEIRMFSLLGGDIVGMTGAAEAVLARELEICYASLCYISNMAAGMQKRLSISEVRETAEKIIPIINEIVKKSVSLLPKERHCICCYALKHARFKG